MALRGELMAEGFPAGQANSIGLDPVATVSAAGTTQANATLLVSSFSNVTTVAANAGVRLPGADGKGLWVVQNNGANVLSVYPATGQKINNGSTNAAIQVAPGKAVWLHGAGTQWVANLGA